MEKRANGSVVERLELTLSSPLHFHTPFNRHIRKENPLQMEVAD